MGDPSAMEPRGSALAGDDVAKQLREAKLRRALFGEQDATPTTIGRFRVIRTLGAGGMGTVFEGVDGQLDRRVAIKVLRGHDQPALEQRLLREAQALARLSHPNVVQIYEVGTLESGLFIAMEYIDGQTLRTWHERPRPWPECLAVYLQAGRGLRAAHAQGLVHRDFKPDNCIIDDEGQVRVLDFGLARDTGHESTESAESLSETKESMPSRSGAALSMSITQTGTLLGTVAYMAPEQLMGRPADERCDQFGFCVALWQAIHGVRPFDGRTPHALLYSIHERQWSEPPDRPQPPVPAWLLRVLRRGLSLRREDRFESMTALLEHLERKPRRRWILASATLAVGLAAGAGAVLAQPAPAPCQSLRDQPAPAWTAEHQRSVEAAILGVDSPLGSGAWAQARDQLDAYAETWAGARLAACTQTRVDHTAGDETLALRMACLDRQMLRMEATVDQLAHADAAVVAHAAQLVRALPPVDPCLDAEALHRGPPPVPPQLAANAREVRLRIDRSWVAGSIDRGARGLDLADEAVTLAKPLDEAPRLLAEALYNRGHLLRWARRLPEARQDLESALAIADRIEDTGLAIDALRRLFAISVDERDRSASRAWMASAQGKLRRLDAQPRYHALRLQLEGQAALERGEHEVATRDLTGAVEGYRQQGPAAQPDQIRALVLLGQTHRAAERDERAMEAFTRAMEIAEHESLWPMVATVADELGFLHFTRNRFDEAIEPLTRSIELRESIYGQLSPACVMGRITLGHIHQMRGELDQAEALAHLVEQSLGPRVPPLLQGQAWTLLASLHRAHGRVDEALAAYAHARQAWLQMSSPDHLELAMLDSNVADGWMMKGQPEHARPRYEQALRTLEAHASPDDHRWIYPLYGLGSLLAEAGEAERAAKTLRRALRVRQGLAQNPMLAGLIRFALIQSLEQLDDPPWGEMVGLADAARAKFMELGQQPLVDQLDAWRRACTRCSG